jgi:predicted PurR-regulated permease PerM
MDIMVTAVVAVVIAIMGVLIALVTRKKIGKVFIYAIVGLIVGLPVGYFLTPFVISFF